MQVRHFFSLATILLVAFLHFGLQWYAWKVHRFEIPLENSLLAPPADYLWKVCSWPMFHIMPRRNQHLNFLPVLMMNSLAWGAAFLVGTTSVWRLGARVRMRRRKKHASSLTEAAPIRTAPPTRLERVIELNAMLNRRRITEEEYRGMRAAIMRENDPDPEPVGLRVTPVTYTVPPDITGADHVAWLDEAPRSAQGKHADKRGARRERSVPARRSSGTGRDR